MTGADLEREYLAALCATELRDLAPLRAAGIGARGLAIACPAIARVKIAGEGFELDAEGGAAYLVPIRVDDPISPETTDPAATLRSSAIVDLVAIHPRHPDRWALRVGTAEWLGAVHPQYLDPALVPVWRSPLAWLRGGCTGLVILSRERADAYRLLADLRGGIIAEDARHAAELRTILAQPWPLPRVIVGGLRRAA
jgi:hypothetical protein